NLARLALELSHPHTHSFRIIVGSGSNGGGGLVAARRLRGWGFETEVFLPRRKQFLRKIPAFQLERAMDVGVTVVEEIPLSSDRELVVLDAYLGYGFKPRRDDTSEKVYEYLRSESRVISLDVPSGFDSTSGESFSHLKPVATMSVAFLKTGHLLSPKNQTGELFVADIGVPLNVYQSKIDLDWNSPYSLSDLNLLYSAYAQDPLQKVEVSKSCDTLIWNVINSTPS
ncbi:MAG: NAD(P)H-hydrate epimerase, partial [Candidatus Thorarchaeota archaeon]